MLALLEEELASLGVEHSRAEAVNTPLAAADTSAAVEPVNTYFIKAASAVTLAAILLEVQRNSGVMDQRQRFIAVRCRYSVQDQATVRINTNYRWV